MQLTHLIDASSTSVCLRHNHNYARDLLQDLSLPALLIISQKHDGIKARLQAAILYHLTKFARQPGHVMDRSIILSLKQIFIYSESLTIIKRNNKNRSYLAVTDLNVFLKFSFCSIYVI